VGVSRETGSFWSTSGAAAAPDDDPPSVLGGKAIAKVIEHFEGQEMVSPLGRNSSWLFPALEITIFSGLKSSTDLEDILIEVKSPIS